VRKIYHILKLLIFIKKNREICNFNYNLF